MSATQKPWLSARARIAHLQARLFRMASTKPPAEYSRIRRLFNSWRNSIVPGGRRGGKLAFSLASGISRWSIAKRLAALVVALAAPLTIMTALVLWDLAKASDESLRKSLFHSARALGAAVDAMLSRYEAIARVLAASPAVLEDNLEGFAIEARRAFAGIDDAWVLVTEVDGTQLVNLRRSGEQEPAHRHPVDVAAHQRAIGTGRVLVSDLFVGPVAQRWVATIELPIVKDGSLYRVLVVTMEPSSFRRLLAVHSLPRGWGAAILDSQGRIVTRNSRDERLVGQLASAKWRAGMQRDGVLDVRSVEGEPRIVASVRTEAGWVVGSSISRNALHAEIWRSLWWVALTAAGIVIVSIAVAMRIARGISRPILELGRSAPRLLAGEAVALVPSLPETDEVAFELRQAARQLRDSELKLAQIFKMLPVGVAVFDRTGTTTMMNDEMRRFIPSGLIPMRDPQALHRWKAFAPDGSLVGPEDFPGARAFRGETVMPGQDFLYDSPDRGEIWTRVAAAPLRTPMGEITGAISVTVDIDLLKRTEERLRESEERFRTLASTAPVGIYLTDAAGHCVYANSYLLGLLGMQLGEASGDGWKEALDPEDRQRVLERWDAARADKHPFRLEYRLRTPAGEILWVLGHAVPLVDAASRVAGYIGMILDISERKAAEQALLRLNAELDTRVAERTAELESEMRRREEAQHKLAQAQRLEAIGKLAGGLAHDFNNGLAAISAYLSVAEAQIPEGNARDAIEKALEAVDMSAGLNRRFLALSRRDHSTAQLAHLDRHIERIAALLKRTLGEDIELVTRCAPGAWPVRVDPGDIDSTLLNLAINARDAMPTGGRLTIGTANVSLQESEMMPSDDASPGDYVRLSIRDTGTGMTPEVAAQAREPFFTTKERASGSGLGLSVVQEYVRSCRGFMRIASGIGQGTTISLYFPRAVEAVRPAAPSPGEEADVPLGDGELVLVVDDNTELLEALHALVEGLGYAVASAGSGLEALELLEKGPGVDIVLCDVRMAGMSGYQLARDVRSKWPGTRIVLMSGYHDERDRTDPEPCSFDVLGKPLSRASLAQVLRSALDGRFQDARDTSPVNT